MNVLAVIYSLFVCFLGSALQQGNRSSSSACGSADVLEELGVAIELEPEVCSDIYTTFVFFIF